MITFIRLLLAMCLAAIVWTALAAVQLVPPPLAALGWSVDWMHWMGFLIVIVGWILSVLHERAIGKQTEKEMLRDA